MKLYLGTVYMITSEETEKIYIGSTTQLLSTRFANHKSDYRCGKGGSYREILQYLDVKCDEIDRMYVTQSRADPELLKLEGKYQLINKDICVNKLTSRGLNRKEHDRRCKCLTSYKEKQKIYRQSDERKKIEADNYLKEPHQKYIKEYRIKNKEHAKQYNHFNKTSFFGQLCKMYKIYN